MKTPETMKAIMAYGRNNYALERDVPVPQIENPGDIILRIEACGICGSDVMWYRGTDSFWGTEIRFVTGNMLPMPLYYGRVLLKSQEESAKKKRFFLLPDGTVGKRWLRRVTRRPGMAPGFPREGSAAD